MTPNYIFRKLGDEFDNCGLEMEMGKKQYIVIGSEGQNIHTERATIKNITSYKYLGVTLTADGKDITDIHNKVIKGKTIIR